MSSLAPAVYRGPDGSKHFLSSSRDGSELIITDPVVGVSRISFDGPCRLLPRSPSLPVGYDAIHYEMISATGSAMVTVRPGQPPFEHSIGGVCWACMDGGHDFELWPVCPRGDRAAGVEVEVVAAPLRAVDEPVPAPEPEPVSGTPPEAATGDAASLHPVQANGMMEVPMVRVGDGDPTYISEIESPRWGPGWLS